METIEEVKADLLAEGAEDFLGFWQFLWEVRETLGVTEAPADRELTLSLIQELLERGFIDPGFPIGQGPGFAAWNVSPAEAMQRIKAAWDSLEGDPFTGDIVWFVTTAKGEEWLRTHPKRQGEVGSG